MNERLSVICEVVEIECRELTEEFVNVVDVAVGLNEMKESRGELMMIKDHN